MKKSTLPLIILGGLLIIVGGFGAFFTRNTAVSQVTTDLKENYALKGDTLTVAGSGNQNIYFYTSDKNEVEVTNSHTSFGSTYPTVSFNETDQTIKITSTKQHPKKMGQIVENICGGNNSNHLAIGIPKQLKKIVLKNVQGNLGNVQLDTLEVKNNTEYLHLNDTTIHHLILSDKVSLTGEKLLIDKLTLNATGGYQEFYNSNLNQVALASENNRLTFSNVKAKTIQGTVNNGEVHLSQLNSEVDLSGDNTSISLGETIKGNLKVQLEKGNLSAELTRLPQDTFIETKTDLGNLQLFQKETPTYGKKNAKYHWDLQTKIGDIDFQSNDDDDDDMHHMDDNDEMDHMMDDMMTEDY